MFGRQSTSEGEQERRDDARLTAVLKQWEPAKSSPDFEAAVWRRIHASRATEPQAAPASPTLWAWFALRPAWSTPIGAAAGILIGIGLALSLPAKQPARHAGPLLHSRTVAGSYLAMATGGAR